MTRFFMTQIIKKVLLKHRGIIQVSGTDAENFLQGLLTNDIKKVSSDTVIYAAFLTPQGKFYQDLFIGYYNQSYFIEIEAAYLPLILKKFTLYKLRSDVQIKDISEQCSVWALWGDISISDFSKLTLEGKCKAFKEGLLYRDPRIAEMGYREIVFHSSFLEFAKNDLERAEWPTVGQEVSSEEYEYRRLSLGLPNGTLDMLSEKSIPLECNLDYLHAISWDKGCYLGQELTARTKHRGLIRKRLLKVTIEGNPIAPETPLYKDNKEMGIMKSSIQDKGLALIRLEALQEGTAILYTQTGTSKLSVSVPSWLNLE
jgi:folate-binding protein YgfZ